MPTAGKNIRAAVDDLNHTLGEIAKTRFSVVGRIKYHIYQHRAKYTALVTVPTTVIVMNRHYRPYVETAKVMAVFIHDHGLGKKFLEVVNSVISNSKI